MDLSSRTALVLGGTAGIGKAIAVQLANAGASVIIIGRDADKGAKAQAEMRALAKHDRVRFVAVDLSVMADVRRLDERLGGDPATLDYLVLSAGVIDPTDIRTAEGESRMFASNYLHKPLVLQLLKPRLERSADPRVVVVSAGMPESIMPDWANMEGPRAYSGFLALPKIQAAIQLMVQSLAVEWGARIPVNAIGPGLVETDIYRSSPGWFSLVKPFLRPFMNKPEQVAEAVTWLLTSEDARRLSGYLIPNPRRPQKHRKMARPQDAIDRLQKLTLSALSR